MTHLPEISEVQIIPIKPNNGHVGFCSFVLDGCYFVGSVAIFTKLSGGIRLVFPTKVVGERQMHMHHPISSEMHQHILSAVEEKYAAVFSDVS